MASSPALPQLCDALARGRVALAEIAGLSTAELDALHRVAMERLAAGYTAEAVDMLGGLVALFPFEARYWLGFGAALEEQQLWQQALAAYEAALLLEPHKEAALYRRGRLRLALHDPTGRADLDHVIARAGAWAAHAQAALNDGVAAPMRRTEPGPSAGAVTGGFELADARALPLAESTFDDSRKPPAEEVTHTARVFAPGREITNTAIVRKRKPVMEPKPSREITHTAIVRRSLGVRLTEVDDDA